MGAEPRLTFQVDGTRYAVAAESVREVARVPRLARVPHAPASLIGLGNFRGAVLPVLSFATLVGRPRGAEARILLVDAGEPLGIAVDTLEGLARDADDAVAMVALETLIAASRATAPRRRSVGGAMVATAEAAGHDVDVPLLVFASGGQEFALPLGAVEEVLRLPAAVTSLPQGNAAVVGSIAVRDTLLPLLSLAALLALTPAPVASRASVVVLRIGAHRVGFVVEAMRGIERVAERRIDPLPAVFRRGGGEARIEAIARLDGGRRLVSVLAVEQVLGEALTAELLQVQEDTAAVTSAMVDEPTEHVLLFRIGDSTFGIPVAAVDEVVPVPDRFTRLPNAPAFMQGVMNLRGAVVPVVDQVRRFDGVATSGRKRRIVVVRIGAMRVGLTVDAVSDVLRVPLSEMRDAPELGGETRVFDRVANLADDERIVPILSPCDLLDHIEQDLLAAFADPVPADRL